MKIKNEVTEIPESSVDTTPKDYQVECSQCKEEIQYTFDPLGEVSTDTIVDMDGYSITCPNCGHEIKVDPKPLDLVVVKIDDVTDYGFFMELMDKNTARKCWFNAWKDEHGYWEYDFNQFQFNMDNEHDIIAKLFQQELNSYSGVIGDFVGEIVQEIKSGKRAKKETKSYTMRDRLKESISAKSSNEKIANYLIKTKSIKELEDFLGYDIEGEELDIKEAILEVLEQMPEEEVNKFLQENKTPTMRGRLKEAKSNDKFRVYYTYLDDEGVEREETLDTFETEEEATVYTEEHCQDFDDDLDYLEIYIEPINENKKIKTEDTTSSEFNLYIKPEELSDVNISSLLFDSDTVIADYKEGNYLLSLIVRGSIKIYDNETGYAYKNYQDFPVELQNLIRAGALGSGDDTNKYTVDMNNWFEWFLDKDDDNVWYDVADIEGMLNKETPEENETELEVIMKDLFDDIVGQLNEGKKVESKKVKTESKRKAINIQWDTDGEDVDLPTEIEIPDNIADEDIEDYITDETGFCHFGFDIVQEVKTESAPADVIEYFGMQDNTDEEYKNNVAKEYKTLRAKYPDKEMILNGDFGTYLGTEKAEPIEKGEYITVYNKVEENVNIEISEDGKEVEVTTDDHEEVEVKNETPEDDDKNEEDTENNESENEEDTEEDSIDDISLSEGTNKKSAEKIAGSMVKKEESTNSVLDVNKIAKFLKQAIEDLTTTDYTCTWYDLDEDLAIFVGWSGGFDPKDTDCIHSKEDPTYAICAEIASTYDYMKTDLDYLTMPYNEEDGEVYDTQSALSKEANFEQEAIYLIDEYKEIRKAVDNGELMLESKKSKKVTESKTSDMDTVDIVMELEGGELTIEDVDDWDTVKALARDLAGSQGFYGRLLRDMDDAEEEYGGVDYLPFPIIL